MLPGAARAQRLSARDFAEIPIKSTDWEMTGLPGDFDEEAVGESKAWPPLKLIECRSHDLVILNRQTLMVEEDLDCPGDVRRSAIVDSVKYPRGFSQCQNPRVRSTPEIFHFFHRIDRLSQVRFRNDRSGRNRAASRKRSVSE
jgi:hypothetical protein